VPAPKVVIEEVTALTKELVERFEALLPQLSSSTVPDSELLRAVIASSATTLLVGRVDNEIFGMCTLVTFTIPTGIRCWIEDVVVDEGARGHGLGAAIVTEAIQLARSRGAKSVDLTSRPGRLEANRLYERLGFERRETNVYRYGLEP
jgi:ribosomal protein S18 acetylase RimI-like enzyme